MQIRYIEYGKVFLTTSRGAREYSVLDRSDNELIPKTKNFYLDEIAVFSSNANLQVSKRQKTAKISITLIKWDQTNYLFMQLQQRREDEFVEVVDTGYSQRSYNQARFVFIDKKELSSRVVDKLAVVSGLIFENTHYPGQKRLKDYIDPLRGKIINNVIEDDRFVPITSNFMPELLSGIVNGLYEGSQPGKEINGKLLPRTPKSLFIKIPLDLDEKIHLFNCICYWTYPILDITTFTSDYVTDREITLFLCDEFHATGQVEAARIFDTDTLRNAEFQDYFGAVCSLSKTELGHETLLYYLRSSCTPANAVTLFRAIETNYPLEVERILEVVLSNLVIIKDIHLAKIIQQHFTTDDELNLLCNLLPSIPIHTRTILLEEILEKTNRKLERFYTFYLKSLNGIDPQGQDAFNLREFLRTSICCSTAAALDQIQQEDKNDLYIEMIWAEFELDENGNFAGRHPGQQFAGRDDDASNQLLFSILMERHENEFLYSIQPIFSTAIGTLLLDQIIKWLGNHSGIWNLETIHKLWSIVPTTTSELFVTLLIHLIEHRSSYDDLVMNASILKQFLLDGQNLLDSSSYQKQTKRKDYSPIATDPPEIHMGLLSLIDDKRSLDLRTACLTVACSKSANPDNIDFAYTWLTTILAHSERNILTADYKKLIEHYSHSKISNFSNTVVQELFLLSGGKVAGDFSIAQCIPINNYPQQQAYFDTYFFYAIVNIWLEMELTIPSSDIALLIRRLPEVEAEKILEKLVLSQNEIQQAEFTKLDPQSAIKWLKTTAQSRLINSNGEDVLLSILINLRNPNIEFVLHILIFESANFGGISSWADYSNRITCIYQEVCKTSSSDPLIDNYLLLISEADFIFDFSKYQELLLSLASVDIKQKSYSGMRRLRLDTIVVFIVENRISRPTISQRVCLLLNSEASHTELEHLIRKANEETISILFDFITKYRKFLDHRILFEIENEYRKRKQAKETFKANTSTLSFIHSQSNAQPQASWFLMALYIGLLFVGCIIFLLVFIASNEAIYKRILDLLY